MLHSGPLKSTRVLPQLFDLENPKGGIVRDSPTTILRLPAVVGNRRRWVAAGSLSEVSEECTRRRACAPHLHRNRLAGRRILRPGASCRRPGVRRSLHQSAKGARILRKTYGPHHSRPGRHILLHRRIHHGRRRSLHRRSRLDVCQHDCPRFGTERAYHGLRRSLHRRRCHDQRPCRRGWCVRRTCEIRSVLCK